MYIVLDTRSPKLLTGKFGSGAAVSGSGVAGAGVATYFCGRGHMFFGVTTNFLLLRNCGVLFVEPFYF